MDNILGNTEKLGQNPYSSPSPMTYANLLTKLRNDSESNTSISNDNIVNLNTNTNTSTYNYGNKNLKPRFVKQYNNKKNPRLSPEEYSNELKKCQKLFFVNLAKYLKEEIVIKTKPDSKNTTQTIKKTNLQKIQDGSSVNIMKIFLNKNHDDKIDENTSHDVNPVVNPQNKYIDGLEYFDNLISNRQMNFVETLSDYMSKYGVITTFKGKNNILIHSQYLIV